VKGAFECLICKAGLLPTRVEPRECILSSLDGRSFFVLDNFVARNLIN
jgi:hypothetical protein